MNFLFTVFFYFFCVQSTEVLRHVHVVYRHGDRSPTNIISDNIEKKRLWPNGLGQLTDTGIRQQFALGKWLRIKYNDLLRQPYNYKDINVKSTDVDRTLMSAQSNLAGLYYDESIQIIPGLNWRPIPVRIIPRISDTLILPKKCNKYREALEMMWNTDYYQSLYAKYQPALDAMRIATRNPKLKFEDSWFVYNYLFCEREHNITADPWVTEELYGNITMIYKISWKMMYHTNELGKLSGGRFLDQLVNEMKDFALNNSNQTRPFQMISGHDQDVAALLSALGVYDGERPPYNACLMFELIHRPRHNFEILDNWIVKIFYKTSSTDLKEQRLWGCKSRWCTLGSFIDYVRPRTISEEKYLNMCPSSGSGTIN